MRHDDLNKTLHPPLNEQTGSINSDQRTLVRKDLHNSHHDDVLGEMITSQVLVPILDKVSVHLMYFLRFVLFTMFLNFVVISDYSGMLE